jgi:hypothetical protein
MSIYVNQIVFLPESRFSFRCRRDDDDEEEMADNFIEFGAAGSGGDHVKELPEIITPQHIDDEDLVTVFRLFCLF